MVQNQQDQQNKQNETPWYKKRWAKITAISLGGIFAFSLVVTTVQANTDSDDDGVNNYDESATYDSDRRNPDTDGDGLTDGEEVSKASNLLLEDSDNDKLTDSEEAELGTDLMHPDSDDDGVLDNDEVILTTDPLNPDTDGDTLIDGSDNLPLETSFYTAEITHTVPAVPAGKPTEEVVFTTGQSGTWTCGEDFPAGTYDLHAVGSSYGNVFTDGTEGAGTFGVNEILAPADYSDPVVDQGMFPDTISNVTFTTGDTITTSGPKVQLILKKDGTPAKEAYDVVETAKYDVETKTTTYTQDGEEVDRSKMYTADELDADIKAQIAEE